MPIQALYAIAKGQVGQDRGQIQFYSLDSLIEADTEVRAMAGRVRIEMGRHCGAWWSSRVALAGVGRNL
jgi:hypothetical protein